MADLEGMAIALIRGKKPEVETKVKEALAEGVPPEKILTEGLIAGMSVVGERFRRNLVYVPEVLISARAMKAGMAMVAPLLAAGGVQPVARVVLGTVKGDLHDIGKNLVGIMLKGAGFEVMDLGADVPAARFVDAAQEHGASVIGLSALLTTTMPVMKEVVELVRARGLAGRVKVIVGGAPVSEAWAREIGADSHGYDAANAVERVRALVAGRA